METPQHDLLTKQAPKNPVDTLTDFLGYLHQNGLVVAKAEPLRIYTPDALLAGFFGLDVNALDAERQAMLANMRAESERRDDLSMSEEKAVQWLFVDVDGPSCFLTTTEVTEAIRRAYPKHKFSINKVGRALKSFEITHLQKRVLTNVKSGWLLPLRRIGEYL